jgi:hypothetical protein
MPDDSTALANHGKFFVESLVAEFPITRLHVQVTVAKRGEDNFRIADYSGVDAIFVNTTAFTVLIQSRLHRCW